MKKFILKTGLFLCILYVLALSLQFFIDKGLRNSSYSNFKEWGEIFNSTVNADLIIQGSSRALDHYSPRVLDSALNLNSYNLGLSGWSFHMQYARFLFYLKHNKKPKYIIQNVDPITLNKRSDLFEYKQFLPYINMDATIKDAVLKYKGLDWRDIYIPLYKYHSNWYIAMEGLKSCFRKSYHDNGNYKGFQALHTTLWDSRFSEFKNDHPHGYRVSIDHETLSCFDSFLNLCKKEGIKLIFVYAPDYIEGQKLLINQDSIMTIFSTYALRYDIPFLNYSKDSICLDTRNFVNSTHMNLKGTNAFNFMLANDLKKIIKEP